jgi:hypothetical protein
VYVGTLDAAQLDRLRAAGLDTDEIARNPGPGATAVV